MPGASWSADGRGRARGGLDVLAEALAAYAALLAPGDVDRVAHLLRAHGRAVPRTWRGGRKGYGSALSPRERDVVGLAAEGLTNREIADALHRSHHTVASQLRSAMKKVGAPSRAALVARVTAAGLLDDRR
ncbi:helix-turn-helix transcriptional regulator [Nocardioides sp. TF02-7]|uniref:helix-turn-helix transcriptional regulator n=1 Tax=Nocardioides sp. TF02-7 TaxID=2917724 RepID=UPI001F06A3F5|nr:helix-turn-helix transcriptional regulator [Nocardioides sp. TF02-7]UMG92876.1 helix-turn-helix transcriptional regulator [Nocardioides sp. TF02-7]